MNKNYHNIHLKVKLSKNQIIKIKINKISMLKTQQKSESKVIKKLIENYLLEGTIQKID